MIQPPEWINNLESWVGGGIRFTPLSPSVFQVYGTKGDFIVRLPKDDAHLKTLRKEALLSKELQGRVTLQLPDILLIEDSPGCPTFSIHRRIPGQPLTSEMLECFSPQARNRLIEELANFFFEVHQVSLSETCEWLGIPFTGKQTLTELATTFGKPTWFSPEQVAGIREEITPILDATEIVIFEDTVHRFTALEENPNNMVFGHGDMHGYNIAMLVDELGPRLVGAFDLECAGIIDIHEDFFRLELISGELLDSVINRYQNLSVRKRIINRERLKIYYRAFLFHLMVGKSGPDLAHLRNMLMCS